MSSKREITKKYAQGYKRLTKAEKKAVLDHLCATCGMDKKACHEGAVECVREDAPTSTK
ncbi:hypothetical protein FACS189481_1790 [Clostridia bacterium]|nr:hypothetical protein FACS189481_1790 [Clostridia bacterium]